MALAPTLATILNQSIGVGLVTLGGLAVTAETGQRGPTVGAVSIAGQVPTISVTLGPSADPDVGSVVMEGRVPFLERILVIAPGLPDSTPEQNDLTPTLVWGDFAAPTTGSAIMQGRAPAVVGNTGQFIAISVGSAVMQGLAPTLSLPAGQEGATAPIIGAAAFNALAPTLNLELTNAIAANQTESTVLTITGFAPELGSRVGWTEVPPATGGWTQIPPV